ncbi:hypothetical protein NQZ79_g326 [Umbelopsis isabellina]|nr:hypothetical protein NQZ79_g326 [Umbelopsis isabellina]
MLSPSKQNSSGYSPVDSSQYDNPFAQSSSDQIMNDNSYIEPDLDLSGQSTTRPSYPPPSTGPTKDANPFAQSTVSGNIGTSYKPQGTTPTGYTGEDTLDEPVSVTIMRDLRQVAQKLRQVLYPQGDRNVLRDWDLWGPLLLCLALAITLSAEAPADQAVAIFTGVFVIVWLGAAVVTLNAKMLGGTVSFFQSVCVIGYCLFPLVLVSFITIFVKTVWIRLPLAAVTFAWSTYGESIYPSDV